MESASTTRYPYRVSIVVPVYNEEGTIIKTLEECHKEICTRFCEWEIIAVNDASDDGTGTLLSEMEAKLSSLTVLNNSENRGHGPTLQRGLTVASGDLVFVIDSDYQHRPADFWSLYSHWDESSIVMGCRLSRIDGWQRKLISRLGNLGMAIVGRKQVRDINIPFKLFPGVQLAGLLETLPENSRVPSTLLIVGAIHRGIPVIQIPVEHLSRQHGQSSLAGLRFLWFSIRAATEILRYKVLLIFTR